MTPFLFLSFSETESFLIEPTEAATAPTTNAVEADDETDVAQYTRRMRHIIIFLFCQFYIEKNRKQNSIK